MVVLDQYMPIAVGNSYLIADVHWGTTRNSAQGQSWNQHLYDKAKVTSVVVYASKAGTPTGTLKCRIASHTGTYGTSSKPLADLEESSNSKDIAAISSNDAKPSTLIFYFDGLTEIMKDVPYTFYVYCVSGVMDGSNYVKIWGYVSHDGNRFYNTLTEGIWASSSDDVKFTVNGDEIPPVGIASKRLLVGVGL